MILRTVVRVLLAAAAVAGIVVALQARGSSAPRISLISVKDEIQLGRQTQGEVRKHVPQVTDRAVVDYVSRIGRRVAARAGGPPYPYSFSIANYRELNAFALPGGPVWVHRGILHDAANESQLAGVLAHEVAHIALRHAADQMTKQLVANGLLGLLGAMLGNDGGGARAARVGAQVLANGYLLKFSRDDEREADSMGMQILRRAGWDAKGMADFMDTLARRQGSDPGSVAAFLSSHPAPAERAATLRKTAARSRSGRRDSDAFQSIRARLRTMPPPKAMKR